MSQTTPLRGVCSPRYDGRPPRRRWAAAGILNDLNNNHFRPAYDHNYQLFSWARGNRDPSRAEFHHHHPPHDHDHHTDTPVARPAATDADPCNSSAAFTTTTTASDPTPSTAAPSAGTDGCAYHANAHRFYPPTETSCRAHSPRCAACARRAPTAVNTAGPSSTYSTAPSSCDGQQLARTGQP